MRKWAALLYVSVAIGAAVMAVDAADELSQTWTVLFDGENLDQWTISETSGHGNTQAWTVEDGAIVGTQDRPGNGGILLSRETYGDFILELELNPDWGLDSGIFLRSTPDGKAYQVMVDYHDGGTVGGIYGEGIGGFAAQAPDYLDYYKKGEWNRMIIAVSGNPAAIDVWLNGHHLTSWQDTGEKKLDAKGHVALQVHAGEQYEGLKARFRNIRIRPLNAGDDAPGTP